MQSWWNAILAKESVPPWPESHYGEFKQRLFEAIWNAFAPMRERREDESKAAKARAFLRATGSVAERESHAILSEEYLQARERYYAAVEADEEYRNQRSKCEAIIEAWRTVQSNYRAMGKVAA